MFISAPISLLVVPTIVLSSLIALASRNWLMAWISIEVNLLRFIPIILTNKTNQESESAVTYFLAQALGSRLILYSSISLSSQMSIWALLIILRISLVLKLGAAPCHYWFPRTMIALSWSNCLILASWQKIAPLGLLAFLTTVNKSSTNLLICAAAARALLGGLLGLNQTQIRIILAYSSITHIGWILGALTLKSAYICITYFFLYCVTIGPLFLIFILAETTTPMQFSKFNSFSPVMLAGSMLLLLSLAGLPPLTGFLPKWLIISLLAKYNLPLILTLLIGSFINLYFYLNLALAAISSIFTSDIEISLPNTAHLSALLFLTSTCSLGLITTIIYAMTLFYKPQRYWNPIYSIWTLSGHSGYRNKLINPTWTIPTRVIFRQGPAIQYTGNRPWIPYNLLYSNTCIYWGFRQLAPTINTRRSWYSIPSSKQPKILITSPFTYPFSVVGRRWKRGRNRVNCIPPSLE